MTMPSKSSNNIESLPKNECYGCAVCVSTCPVNCIQMAADSEGFLYPQVDEPKCIECRACIDTCPGFKKLKIKQPGQFPTYYAGFTSDDQTRYKSSSGGIFSLIADIILSSGGTVFGAVYDLANMQVVHTRAENEYQILPMRKSKYVQSDTTNIFPQVQKDLNQDRPVLFTGTPCQVDGLYQFLGQSHNNLYTADIICHGVPSPGLFQAHFNKINNSRQDKLTNIDFRTKAKGWGSSLNLLLELEFSQQKKYSHALMDAYYAIFLANLSLRPCCYQCQYASITRVSDITMGDFWGVQKNHPNLFDRKGTSLILINTPKGEGLLQSMRSSAKLQKIDHPRPFPPNLEKPSSRPQLRGEFLKKLNFNKWDKAAWRCHLQALSIIVKHKLLEFLK